jgi:hypothetical protein
MTLGTLGPDGLHRATEETQASVSQVAPVRSRLKLLEYARIRECPKVRWHEFWPRQGTGWHEFCFHDRSDLLSPKACATPRRLLV